MKIISNMSSW